MSDHEGIWLDVESGKVGRAKPSRGKLLVGPGEKIPEHVADMLDGKVEAATAPSGKETAEAPKRARKRP